MLFKLRHQPLRGTREDAVPVSMTIPEVKSSDAWWEIYGSLEEVLLRDVSPDLFLKHLAQTGTHEGSEGLLNVTQNPRMNMERSWALPFGIEPWALWLHWSGPMKAGAWGDCIASMPGMRREAAFSLRSPFFFFYLGESLGTPWSPQCTCSLLKQRKPTLFRVLYSKWSNKPLEFVVTWAITEPIWCRHVWNHMAAWKRGSQWI